VIGAFMACDLIPWPLLLKEKGKTTHSKPLSFRRGVGVRSQADNLCRRAR